LRTAQIDCTHIALCTHTPICLQGAQQSGLPSALLREVLQLPDLRESKETAPARNASDFIEALAAQAPRFMHASRMLLLPLLNCKCYSIRNAVISTLGRVCGLSAEEAEVAGEEGEGEGEEEQEDSEEDDVVVGDAEAGGGGDKKAKGSRPKRGGAMDKESRDLLLDLLLERAHDVSA
jgi:hypothetical protein